jgi:hypothetical protein
MRLGRWVCLGWLGLAAWGCSSEKAATTPAPVIPPDGLWIGADALQAVTAAAPSPDERDNAAVKVLEKARLAPVPLSSVNNRDLSAAAVGKEGTFSFDVDADGDADEVYAFTPNLEPVTFLAWSTPDLCHLAWTDSAGSWHLQGPCAGTEALVCHDGSCGRCSASACEACEVSGQEIRCDAASNNANNGDADAGDVPPSDDVPQEDVFVPDRPGECSIGCLSQADSYCCKACGCEGEVKCVPECATGTAWDCELGCCFDYQARACDCAFGSDWDPGQTCCVDSQGTCLPRAE